MRTLIPANIINLSIHKIKQKTGTMDQSWRGEIKKYPPNPERFVNTASLWSKGKPKEEGGGLPNLEG